MSWKCFDCFGNQVEDVHTLDYQHRMLYDVPTQVFAYERTLEELKLDANRIRDLPRPLFHCHGLKILSLCDNDIQTLPPAVASLINLQQLDLSKNALSAIPDNIKCCKQLHRVDVSINPLEKLPEGFTQLINLQELYLNDTYLDFLPANFGRLTKLKILELRENNLNTLPKSIARLCKLERLDLGQNEFSDMPEAIGSLTNLTELWVDCNRIKSISSLIGNLKKLIHFDASNNNINWISSSIEKCERLVDLTLSCNELREIPSSIGHLKELTTLKLDDNQLKTVPSSIGKIPLLQELILNQNNLESLPSTIGLLRRLHILNVDDNVLEDLPPEIGSCSCLTLLSVRNNKLQEVPAELGHLQKIKVINLSDNLLRNLPVSLLNLTHLNALWLSNNQSTPLTILQKEFDRRTGQMVCVNFMLPQTPQHLVAIGQCSEPEQEAAVRSRPHIRFAIETEDEEPNHLLRAPTPYPKELRAMAKHARAIHQPSKQYKQVTKDAPLLGQMRTPWPSDLQIKEAKVKKPETFSLSEQSKPALLPALIISESIQETRLHAVENRPIIREAKYVRQRNSTTQQSGSKLADEIHDSMPSLTNQDNLRASIASSSLEHPLQPPPYHIAAAYSKQAKWFGHLNAQLKVENWTKNLCYDDNVSNSLSQDSKQYIEHSTTSPSSPINTTKSHTVIQITGSENNCPWSSQPNHADYREEVSAHEEIGFHEQHKPTEVEDESHYIKNNLFGTCLERVGSVRSNNCVASMFDGDDGNSKHLDSELHIPEITSQSFLDSSQNVQSRSHDKVSESESRTLENFIGITNDTFCEHVGNNYVDLLSSRKISSRNEEELLSNSLDKVMNGSVPFVNNDLDCIVESNIDCDIAESLGSLVLSSPETDARNNSSHFSQIQNGGQVAHPPKIPPGIQNDLFISGVNKILHKVPSTVPMSSNKDSENRNYLLNDDNLSDALSTEEWCVNEHGRVMPNNYHGFPHNTSVSKSNYMLQPCDLVKSSTVENIESHYKQESAAVMTTTTLPNHLTCTNVPTLATPSKGHTKLWKFGLHRNPTVLPILINKTEELGFVVDASGDMSSLQQTQRGIYIVSVDASGPASSLLLPGDKILEVDGVDFTKLNYEQAVKILLETGSVIHMMISRQQ